MTLIVSRLRKYSSRVQDLVVECETNKWLENRRHRKITSDFDKAEMSIKQKHTLERWKLSLLRDRVRQKESRARSIFSRVIMSARIFAVVGELTIDYNENHLKHRSDNFSQSYLMGDIVVVCLSNTSPKRTSQHKRIAQRLTLICWCKANRTPTERTCQQSIVVEPNSCTVHMVPAVVENRLNIILSAALTGKSFSQWRVVYAKRSNLRRETKSWVASINNNNNKNSDDRSLLELLCCP